MRFTTMAMTAAATLALAACNQADTAKTDASEAASGGATATGAAASLDGPRPGLWRVTTTTSMPGAPAIPATEVCIREAKFEAPNGGATGGAGANCTTTEFKREGDAVTGSSSCTMNGMKTDTTTRITGDFNSRYVMESTTKMDPAPTPTMAEVKMTMTGERIGDCPAS